MLTRVSDSRFNNPNMWAQYIQSYRRKQDPLQWVKFLRKNKSVPMLEATVDRKMNAGWENVSSCFAIFNEPSQFRAIKYPETCYKT
jgi:hypothetical protein